MAQSIGGGWAAKPKDLAYPQDTTIILSLYIYEYLKYIDSHFLLPAKLIPAQLSLQIQQTPYGIRILS